MVYVLRMATGYKQVGVFLVAGVVFYILIYLQMRVSGLQTECIRDDFRFEVSPCKKKCSFNRGVDQREETSCCCGSGFVGAPRVPFEYMNLTGSSWKNENKCPN
jgi:hypothetical protein